MADITEYDIKIKFSESGAEKTADDVKKVQSSVDKLKSAVKGLGIGVVLKKATDAIGGFINKTSDYIETVNLFRASMGSAADEAQKFIDKAEGVLGLDPGNLMDSISSFYNMADGMGIASDRAYTMSQNLTQLAGDLSSFANISFEEAQKKLMSGFAGQVLPLRRYGIALDQASLQETAYSLGLQQKVKEMTRAQKSELIYYQIMTSTQKMQGDLGRTLNSPANALRIMKNEFNKLAREIGMVFIPIAMKIIPVIIAITEVILDGVKAIASFFNIDIGDYTASTEGVGDLLQGIGDDIGGIGDEADETAKKLNRMLMPFDELNNLTMSKNAGAGIGGVGGGSLGIDLPQYDMFANVSTKIREEVDKIKEKIEKLLPLLATIGTIIAGWKVANGVVNFFNALKAFDPTTLAIAAGLTLTITGITLFYGSMKKMLNGDLTAENLLKGLAGAGTTGLGIGLLALPFGASLLPVTLTVAIALSLVLVGTYLYKWEEKNLYKPLADKMGMDWDGANFLKKLAIMADIDLQVRGLKKGEIQEAISEHEKGNILESLAFDSAAKSIVENWDTISNTFSKIGEGIKNFFSGIGETISGAWESFKEDISGIGDFFNYELPGDIDLWFTRIFETIAQVLGIEGNGDSTEFTGFGEKIMEGFKAGITGKWDEFWNAIGGENGIFPTLIEKVKGLFGIHSPSTVFEEIGENLIQGLVNGIGNIWNTLTSKFDDIKNLTNFSWSLPSLKVPQMYWSTMPAPDWAAKILKALSLPTNVPKLNVSWVEQYAEGGFPNSGQLFIANEAGPELVGNIGNRTAVANKDQITTAIANATYEAISRALAENNQNNGQPIIVNVGNEQLYKGYTRYQNQQSNMYGINV